MISQERKKHRKQLSGSALQLTVVLSLVISILLACLIYLFYFYRQQEARISNKIKLMELLDSGITLGLSNDLPYGNTVLRDILLLEDSLHLSKQMWGLYDVTTVIAYNGNDSLSASFMVGMTNTDSTVLYLADEDRNLSVSGETRIRGQAYLPAAGIKPAFVDGSFYKGKEEIVEGVKKTSDRQLPPVYNDRLLHLLNQDNSLPEAFSQAAIQRSFYGPTSSIHVKTPLFLEDSTLKGNIILQSDTLLEIGSSSSLTDIICIAPVVRIKSGFKGRLQVLATDSLVVEDGCTLAYPSTLALYPKANETICRLSIGKNSTIQGSVLLYESTRSSTPHLLELGEEVQVSGDLIAFGMLKYHKPLRVQGSTYCYRFITQTPSSLYENYLIDATLDRGAQHPYFLKAMIWQNPPATSTYQIINWLY